MKSYQIIELASLDELIKRNNLQELGSIIILWLINRIKEDFADKKIELDLIKVSYLGSYPAMGIHYLVENSEDFGLEIEEKCEAILKKFPFNDFLSFVINHQELIEIEISNFQKP